MRRYLLIGALAFLALLVWRLPASWVAALLPGALRCADASGSLWNGRCGTLRAQGLELQGVSWQLAALPLLTGTAEIQLQVDDARVAASARVRARTGGAWRAEHVSLRLPLEHPQLHLGPPGYRGNIVADLAEISGHGATVAMASGTVQLLQLRSSAELGSYEVRLGPAADGDGITGELRDLEGPLQVDGQLRLRPHGYELQGHALPRNPPGEPLAKALDMLGPPDADGRRPFSVEGTF